ncbi:MAG TPA: TonB-dependent receptor, partial [Bacteroidota bacterium]|nr:TonB-dependent receptor [Bacteroidota bacterium]
GSVNMQLREAPSGLHSDLMWQSGYTAKNNVYSNYKALGSVSDRFFDDLLGVYLLVNAEQYDRGADNFSASYKLDSETLTPGLGFAPVSVASMTLDRHIETRSRYGGNLILDYRLPAGSISLINMASRLHSDYQDYQTNWDYQGKNLNFNYGAGKANTDIAVDAVQGKYDFGFMAADISVANNYSRNFNPKIDNFQFAEGSGIYSTPIPSNVPPQSLISLQQFNDTANFLQQVGYSSADFKENDQTYSANFKIPFNIQSLTSGFFKVGGTHRHYVRNNDESAPYAGLRYQGNELVQFINESADLFPSLIYDPGAMQFRATNLRNPDNSLYTSFLNNKYGSLIWAPQIGPLTTLTDWIIANHSNSLRYYDGDYVTKINDYQYTENYNAAYAMTELNFGTDLMVVGGARYENDKSDIIAYHVQQQNNWLQEKAKPDTVYPSNHYWLPMVQAKFSPFEWGDLRYAYTQTLARPNFTQLSPYENLDQNGQGVSAGNPHLRPAHSFNHDLMITVHNNDIGLVSVGGFYKTIEDFSYFIQYSLLKNNPVPGYDSAAEHPGAQNGAQIYTFYNNPYKAFIKGIEVDLQTRFWYLPAPFDGLLLNVNYTHIKSNTYYPIVKTKLVPPVPPAKASTTVAYDSSRAGRLIFQPNDVLNASIGYDYAGFSGRISFLFQGNMVSSIAARSEQDGFTKDYFRIDATVRQKLPIEGLQLFLDVNNINQRTDISAQETFGGSTSEIYYGLTADLGLRYTF